MVDVCVWACAMCISMPISVVGGVLSFHHILHYYVILSLFFMCSAWCMLFIVTDFELPLLYKSFTLYYCVSDEQEIWK